jgi:tRNA(Ile)-lysidine synthetase-like protein
MSTTIIDFWRDNRSYWITLPNRQKEVDEVIRDKFWIYDWSQENLIGQVIYLDQFSRHFARLGLLDEIQVRSYRINACALIMIRFGELIWFNEVELVFALMPFKHLERFDFIFNYIHSSWLQLNNKKLYDCPDLMRFYMDTYKKAYTLNMVSSKIITEHDVNKTYDSDVICDYYPDKYLECTWDLFDEAENCKELMSMLDFKKEKVIVSLSGGVDSMVMLSLLKYGGADVEAVHIVYGNRAESEMEYAFLAEFCRRLDIKLSVYRIEWLRRGDVDREFYEDMTRDLRFMVYKTFNAGTRILLGHIKDDIVENIWTNIAHCHHLGNLKKMEFEEVQEGVRICRPFLMAEKRHIYRASELMGVPYLKNTTPSWSNRGKFREVFHRATVAQFGSSVDDKIIEFAEAVQKQNALLEMLLYQPIYDSYSDGMINITNAIKAVQVGKTDMDANSWLPIFEWVCHKKLGCARPGIKAIRDFCGRLGRGFVGTMNVEMGKGLRVVVSYIYGGEYTMQFIIN